MDDDDDAIRRVIDGVLAYTTRHPTASDTIDGIARWWLGASDAASPGVLRIALDRLVAAGNLQRSVGRDGAVRYSVRNA